MIRSAFNMGIVDWWNVPCYLPVPRADEVHARLLVEAAIFGDSNPEEHAAVMVGYILECDRAEALEAERQRSLPVVQSVEWAMQMEFSHAIYGEPFDFDIALEIAAEGVWDMADGVARASAGLADDVGSFIPVRALDELAVALAVMLGLMGMRWKAPDLYEASWAVLRKITIQQPFYTDTPPSWRRP